MDPTPTPAENSFTEPDNLYVQEFLRHDCFRLLWFHERDLLNPTYREECLLVEKIATLVLASSSKATRYAALAFSAHLLNKTTPRIVWQYLERCHKHLHRSISNSVFVDIVYACYFLMELGIQMKESSEVIFIHASGLSQALRSIHASPSSLSLHEWLWMDGRCQNNLWPLGPRILPHLDERSLQPTFISDAEKTFSIICSRYHHFLIRQRYGCSNLNNSRCY